MEKLNQIKQHVFIYHKGIKVHEDETLYNLFQKQNEFIDFTSGSDNVKNTPKDINEMDFEVILIPYEDEEDIINGRMASNNEKLDALHIKWTKRRK